VLTPLAACAVFQRLHRPVLVALTSRGVVAETEDMPWERIGSVRRDKDGVHLRLLEDGGACGTSPLAAPNAPSPTSASPE
jgi:hypothetical protein